MGDSFFSELSDGMCIGVKCFGLTHNQLRPMTTQTQTQATDQALTDEQLEDLNGAGGVAWFFWALDDAMGLGIPWAIDSVTGNHVEKAVNSPKTI